MMPRGLLFVCAFIRCVAAMAADESAPCAAAPYRAFDFWLGDWTVYDATGALAGENHVTAEEAGCVVVESWRSRSGVTGRSFSFYDPERQHWRQIWISPGSQIEMEGNVLGAHFVLEGHIRYLKNGTVRPFRGTWSPLPDGRVRQYLEESKSAGAWSRWFEGFYRRVGAQKANLDNGG